MVSALKLLSSFLYLAAVNAQEELGQLVPCRSSTRFLGLWETLILKVLAAVSVDVPTIPIYAATWSSAETQLESYSSAYMNMEME